MRVRIDDRDAVAKSLRPSAVRVGAGLFAAGLCTAGVSGCGTPLGMLSDTPQIDAEAVGSVTGAGAPAAPTEVAGASEPKPLEQRRAVPIDGMSLYEAVGLAISRHPDVSRATAVIAQGEAQVAIAQSAWYPTLEYGVQPGYGEAYGSSGRASGVRGTVGVKQLVFDFGRTSSQISAADATLVKQVHLRADAIETVAYTTATAFVDLAASQETVAAALRQAAALQATRAKIGERVAAGLANTTDQIQADVAIKRAEADALKARTQFDVAAGKVAELTGVRPKRVAPLAVTAKFVAALGNGGGDIEQTPSVLAAKAGMEAADAQVHVAEAAQYPSIGLGANKSVSARRNAYDSTFAGVTIGGSFSFGGLAQHQIDAAQAEKRAAEQALENQRLVTRTALNSAGVEASGAAVRLSSYEKVIALSRASRNLYWEEYTLNKRPLTEVINAEREIYQSSAEQIAAAADGALARIKAHVAIGKFVALLRDKGAVR